MKKSIALILALLMMLGTIMASFAESAEIPAVSETAAEAIEGIAEAEAPAPAAAAQEEDKPAEQPEEKPEAEQPEETTWEPSLETVAP